MKKVCSKCKLKKLLTEFSVHRSSEDGRYYTCKLCEIPRFKKYKRSRLGLISKILNDQRKSSKIRGHPAPEYNLRDLRSWAFSQTNFESLYTDWVSSGHKKELVPSCDRLDDSKHYTLSNLRLVTWQENRSKQDSLVKAGFNSKKLTPVDQLDLQGKLIANFYSQSEAARQVGVMQCHISDVCAGRRKQTGGFKWRKA